MTRTPWMISTLLANVLSYPARRVRWKIIAPYAVLAVILAGAGAFLVTRIVTGSLRERFDNQLAESARVTSDAFVRRERRHLEIVRAVAFTDEVGAATQAGNGYALSRLIDPIATNSRAERVEVLNTQGRRIFGIELGESRLILASDEPDDRRAWGIVDAVLSGEQDSLGDKYAQIVQTRDGFALYSAGPIYEDDTFVGVVLVGSLLSNFLPEAKKEALADITVYDFNGDVLASTFVTDEGWDETALSPSFGNTSSPNALRERRTINGRNFELLYGDLVIRNQVVGAYSIGLPSQFIVAAGATTRWQLSLLLSFGTIAVLVTGWLISRSLTEPLMRLVRVARRVAEGDLTARANLRSGDEVGLLSTSFDQMTDRLQKQHLATIRALTSAIDARDPYTLGHSLRVGKLAVLLGESLGLPAPTLQHLEIGGYLHDIGKIGVRDSVLLKPGALTSAERIMIEQHPRIGLDILAPVHLAPEIIEFVAGHHEKLDGSGYPAHLHGSNVSVIQRIAAVADIYDALTTDRPYRAAMTVAQALDTMLREVAAGLLDGEVVSTLASLVHAWEQQRRSDPQLKGYAIPGWPAREAA